MGRSFDRVDNKIAEAEFFYTKLTAPSCLPPEANWYLSAFASAARTVTFGLQSVMNAVDGFPSWYERKVTAMKADGNNRFFHRLRNELLHLASTPINCIDLNHQEACHLLRELLNAQFKGTALWFGTLDDREHEPPVRDVKAAAKQYLTALIELVYDCYVDFGPYIDPKQHYTQEHFTHIGKSIEDAEEELFGIRGWTKAHGYPEVYRWQALRDSQTGCGINHIFEEYLGKMTPEPKRLPDLPLTEGECWYQMKNGGRVYIPEGFRKTGDPKKDLNIFFQSLRKQESK